LRRTQQITDQENHTWKSERKWQRFGKIPSDGRNNGRGVSHTGKLVEPTFFACHWEWEKEVPLDRFLVSKKTASMIRTILRDLRSNGRTIPIPRHH
jgi:hypothetical protein